MHSDLAVEYAYVFIGNCVLLAVLNVHFQMCCEGLWEGRDFHT